MRSLLHAPFFGRLLAGGLAIVLLIAITSAARSWFDSPSSTPPVVPAPLDASGTKGKAAAPASPGANLLLETPEALRLPAARKTSSGLKTRTEPAPAPSGTKLVLVIAGLTLALVGGLALAVRFMKKARLSPAGQRQLKLLDVLPLGAKRQIYVVGFKDRTLLLAASADSVSLLSDYGSEELTDGSLPTPAPAPAPAPATATATATARCPDPPPRALIAAETSMDRIDLSPPARPQSLPRGAHRVPPAFRHLLAKSLGEDAAE